METVWKGRHESGPRAAVECPALKCIPPVWAACKFSCTVDLNL